MSNRFRLYTKDLADSIELMLVGAIRTGLEEGFEATLNYVENTAKGSSQDSGNATFHWMIGIDGTTRPGARKKGTLRDLRETSEGRKHPLIGKRRDQIGKNSQLVKALIQDVLSEELKDVIRKHVVGQKPPLKYSFYNAVASATEDDYDKHAAIAAAGSVGLTTAVEYFEKEIAKGNIRKHRRK